MDDVKKKKLTEYLYNPNAKPAKELSEHDQQMIKLGWDAARSSKPSDDEELREKIANYIEVIFEAGGEYLPDSFAEFQERWVKHFLSLIGRRTPFDDEELMRELMGLVLRFAIDYHGNKTFRKEVIAGGILSNSIAIREANKFLSLFGDIRGQERERIVNEVEGKALKGENSFSKTVLFEGDISFNKNDKWWQALKGDTE